MRVSSFIGQTLLTSGCLLIIAFQSCSPRVTPFLTKSFPALDDKAEITVLGLNEPVPSGAMLAGTVRVDDTGFSTNCGYEVAIAWVKNTARHAGCNMVKIVEHQPPNLLSTCDRIVAGLYRIDPDNQPVPAVEPTRNEEWDYAMLYVYRPGGIGPLVSYDLYLGDSVICRVKNKSKYEIKIKKTGAMTLWAKTESTVQIPITIELGRTYYVRCGVSMGAFVGRPVLTLLRESIGKPGYDSFN